MEPSRESVRGIVLAGVVVLVGACAPTAPVIAPKPAPIPTSPGLPAVPPVRGPLRVEVAYPKPDTPLPKVDSTFIFGTVGTGEASLTINGTPVAVAENGAFLAYLPLPANGVWNLEARAGGETARGSVAYRVPAPPPPPPAPGPPSAPAPPPPATPAAPAPPPTPPAALTFPQPRIGVVEGVSDTLETGSDVAPAYPVPTTAVDRRWLFPKGTRLEVVSRQGDLLEARLSDDESAWIEESLLSLGGEAVPLPPPGELSASPSAGWIDVRVPVAGAPFLITSEGPTLSVNLYDLPLPLSAPVLRGDSLLLGAGWRADSTGATILDLHLRRAVWGYKAFYEPDGTLVIRVRRPPAIDPANPLRGIRVALDAGHPPGGAIGPTGLTEAEANLAIVQRLIEQLRAAGAVVVPIRTTPTPLVSATNASAELGARVDSAVAANADLMISVHNNAFPDGVNPFVEEGTSTLYFHPHARDLATALDREIVAVTRIPDLGAHFQNIAIGRITWMPSVITESLFMMFPQQEAALRDPTVQDRIAAAHVRGIEDFLRGRAY